MPKESSPYPYKSELMQCKFCNKESELMAVEVIHPKLPNTFNNLDDYSNTCWKCLHCGCWN